MRKQDIHIFGTALAFAGVAALIDIWRQYEQQKQKGGKLTWDNLNVLRTLKWSAAGGVSGGIVGDEFYKSKFRKNCNKPFSPDSFLKDILKEENVKSNPGKYKEVIAIKREVKSTLNDTFANDLIVFPEDIGSLKKGTALNSSYDADVVMALKRYNSFGSLSNMSTTIHNTIDELYGATATVTRKKKATNILFETQHTPVSIDILYGRETGNYTEDKKLNLYSRPNCMWQVGKHVKTDIGIQKNILVNKPQVREVIKAFKVYFKKNGLPVENVLMDQLVIEAMSQKNYGTDSSVTVNLLNSMVYMSRKIKNSAIKDYANSNNNLLQKIDSTSKAAIISLLSSDLKKIELNSHYIREAFHQ